MKSYALMAVLVLTITLLTVQQIRADCAEEGDGEVKAWFKNIGCSIQKTAGELQESAKPWTDKLTESAKGIADSAAKKYDEIKHKLVEDKNNAPNVQPSVVYDGPTEKIPLAPLNPVGPVPVAAPVATAA